MAIHWYGEAPTVPKGSFKCIEDALSYAKKRDSLKSNRKHKGKTSRKDTPYRMIS
ncbi:MAG: hypothetical protein AAF757_04180 [Cyanobacteria bacterium P01_D01_bin.116]